MFCVHCGKEIKDDASVCKWCGTPIEDAEASDTEMPDMEMPNAAISDNSGLVIAINMLGACAFWLGIVNELAAFLLIGYILLKEEDTWLKAVALKAGSLIVGIGLLKGAFYILQDILNEFNTLLSMIGIVSLGQSAIYQLCGFFITLCGMALNILLIISGYKAMHYENFKISFIDRFVLKNFKK